MSHEVNIHAAQTTILRELLFLPSAGFAALQKPTGLSSDHFTFHISRLLELGLISRVGRGKYALSPAGKEYANRLDTDNNTVERQPKVAVLLAVSDGEQILFQERLKQPYFGYWGLPTGKLRWGETILEGAARELMEETGLEAELELRGVYHEHAVEQDSNAMLEDKMFFVIKGTNPTGSLVERFEGGRNQWMSVDEARLKGKLFASFDAELDIAAGNAVFVESTHKVAALDF